MLQLDNQTPFKATIALLPDRFGIDTLYVIVKATVKLSPSFSLADEQVPVTLADEYVGEPGASSLCAPSDMHIGKPGTDVLLIGSAHPPQGRPVRRMHVTMTVAERQKTIQVSGDRVWRGGQPSEPRPFESMPMTWERAFGGTQRQRDVILAEERNPIGCGFAGGRSAREMEGTPVPNLEEPDSLLQQIGQKTAPACFGPTAPSWLPRRMFAGTYDARWQRSRAPYLPDDFDPRFLQCGSGPFAFDRYLLGGEPVQIAGASPDGPIAFSVPDSRLDVAVTIKGAEHRPAAHLETLTIEPDANRACFTWRAAQPCDRTALKVEKIVVSRPAR